MVDLPAVTAEVGEAASVVAELPASSGRETILVVEDEPAVLGFSSQLLERNGYRVLRAANGNEARDLSRTYSGQIDLVFTDMVMPGISGHDAAAAIRKDRPEIKLLFSSGYSEEMNVARGDAGPIPVRGQALLRRRAPGRGPGGDGCHAEN